jgi:hypothetical protein
LGLAVALLAVLPIRAQLDPRLQSSRTDFMDMYQQSTSLKAKPEIVTVFDMSRSMASLMFHPLYQNNDLADADDYRYMKFQLNPGSGGSGANNRWYIIAYTGDVYGNGGCRSYGYVTINPDGTSFYTFGALNPYCADLGGSGNGGCTINTGSAGSPGSPGNNVAPSFSFYAQSPGNGNAYTRIWFAPDSTSSTQGANDHTSYHVSGNSSTGSFGSPSYTMSVLGVSPSGSLAPNTIVTLTATLTHPFSEGEDITHKGINWGYDQGWLGFNSGAVWTQVSSGVYQSTVTIKIPDFVHAPDNPPIPDTRSSHPGDYSRLAPLTATSTGGTNATWTFKTYFEVQGTGPNNDRIYWSLWPVDTWNICAGGWPIPFRGNATQTTAGTTLASATDIKWDNAAWCNQTFGAFDSYVTAWLDASAGASPVPNISYVGGLTGNTYNQGLGEYDGTEVLRKPDGSRVKASDAITAGGLNGSWAGAGDVRNWLRAASHVRFRSGSRTIDIPLAWKVMDANSTSTGGQPLSSVTYLDKQVKTTYLPDLTPVVTTYGSSTQIEVDRAYQIENANGSVFTLDTNGVFAPNGAQTIVYLYGTLFRPAYISWLFTGKYQSADSNKPNYTTGPLDGKYIAYDASTISGAGFPASGQTNVGWGRGFGNMGALDTALVPLYNLDGSLKTSSSADLASKYRTPAFTRLQATKSAAIQTWIAHQADLFWAFRELDPVDEAGNGTGTFIRNDSTLTINGADATTNHVNGNDSGWKVLNNTSAQGINSASGNSVKGMARIASLFANSQTPLTYAMAGALAQFNDPNSVLNAVVGADVSQCVPQFLLLFTDGVDNNGQEGLNNPKNTTPYITGAGAAQTLDTAAGNRAILLDPTKIDRSGDYWNFFTMAAIGAHLSDPSYGVNGTDYMAMPTTVLPTSGAPHAYLPFAIKQRNGVTYDKDHPVTIMTVGVSLGGRYTDAASPKRSLFLAAVAGDPSSKSGLISGFHGFNGWEQTFAVGDCTTDPDPSNDWIRDPKDPCNYPKVGVRRPNSVYFFDATDPDKLKNSMDFAFRLLLSQGGSNATSSPNLPFTGSSLGKQVYLGTFNPPLNGGVIWPGDLLMFGTKETAGVIHVIDKNGNYPTTVIKDNAQWSASDALIAKLWTSRTLYTRLPGNATNAERGLHAFTDVGAAYTNPDALDNTAGLQNYLNVTTANYTSLSPLTPGGPDQQALIQFASGANTEGAKDALNRPTTNRSITMMGDIIDSAPAPLEYNWNDVKNLLGPYPRLSAAKAAGGNRFRIILVGTNQGWLHAFGEVTRMEHATLGDPGTPIIVKGDVEELWAFMPTDFLANLSYIKVANNSHRFMVDGTPAIYFLDMAPSTGGSGNGVVDLSDPRERAIAVIGMRKGGRSYYALNIKNPFTPTLQWSLVPDEADYLPASRTIASGPALADVQSTLKNFGFSTSTPAFGRVQFGSTAGVGGSIRDAVFLGGGYSVPEVETNFAGNKLGRSVMAVDVWSGEVLAATDLTAAAIGGATVGPVGAGLIPFEYFLNSGMAQRAYFLDYKGGLWAWGSKDVAAADPYKDFRIDTSELTSWQVRKVSQDDNNVASGRGGRYTTLPAPFRVGTFPGVGKTAASVPPTAVGIAMVSGDRNNPLDFQYGAGNPAPNHHRVTVVFDRQDSRAWGKDAAGGFDTGITDADLKDFTANLVSNANASSCADSVFQWITPGCPKYYLSPYTPGSPPAPASPDFGYYINFPSISNNFIPKGINPPIVVAGSLFYSYFTPATADPCTGGTGNTYSWFTTDVMNPIVSDARTTTSAKSGKKDSWVGVASDYIALGTKAVLQGGTVATGAAPPNPATSLEVHTTATPQAGKFPKVRVWRTVH